MSVKTLRIKKGLSQEQLADYSGLSLRTIQRVESGQSVSNSSWKTLAEYFDMSTQALRENNELMTPASLVESRLSRHRALQLIIFVVTFFVCISQWLAYYASLNPSDGNATLGDILTIITEIAFAAAIFAYLFNRSRITFVWSYYATAAAFLLVAIAMDFWLTSYPDSGNTQFLYTVFYTLMLLTLLVFHILQMALSLRGETVILAQR